jgi:lysophospholipase L1-like esterase
VTVLHSIDQTLELAGGMARMALGVPNAWEPSIRKFEARDRACPPAHGGIVFTGSSSFTLWSTLEQDMAPLPAINRGFGGAVMDDVVRYVDRIVLPYQPRAVVLFAGTNDISGPRPASPQDVADGFRAFTERIHTAMPEALVFYVAITPSPARWKLWPIASEANRLTREHVLADPRLRSIDLTDALLGLDGLPQQALYRSDGLHPSMRGYVVWASAIRYALETEPTLAPEASHSREAGEHDGE